MPCLTAAEFPAVRAKLARPDALARLGEIVESTQLEGLFEEVFDHAALWPGPPGRKQSRAGRRGRRGCVTA